jgi:hypothetical protein
MKVHNDLRSHMGERKPVPRSALTTMTCPPCPANDCKPTRCGWGPGFGCRSFANQVRWPLFAALVGLAIVLMCLLPSLPLIMRTFSILVSIAGAVSVLVSMACCTEHTEADEQDTPTAQRCTWGTNLTCATFSNRIRWSVAVLGIAPAFVFLCIALPISLEPELECEHCLRTAVVVALFLTTSVPGAALILSMLCCIEKPFPAQVRHPRNGQRAGKQLRM